MNERVSPGAEAVRVYGWCGPQTLEAKGPHGATRGPLILQAFNNPSAAAATFASNVAGAPLLLKRNESAQELCSHSALAASSGAGWVLPWIASGAQRLGQANPSQCHRPAACSLTGSP